jgi:hypothetical protein
MSVLLILSSLSLTSRADSGRPTLEFSPSVTHMPVKQGGKVTKLFAIKTGGSFQGDVTLAISGLPGGVSASWDHNPVSISSNAGWATLTLAPSAKAAVNWFTFTVTASGDGLRVSQPYVIEVEPAVGVEIQLSQRALSVESREGASLSVTATPRNGIRVPADIAGANAKVISGLPEGVSATWSRPIRNGSGAVTWKLTLNANNSADTGNYPVNLYVQITDQNTGTVYSGTPGFPLLVSLLADATISTTPKSTIPSDFMGISLEWGSAQGTMGESSIGTNMIFRQLLSNLTAYGSAPINIRIGGNSTDFTGEPNANTVRPFAELAQDVRSHFELGVNLGADNVQLATNQAKAYVKQMPSGTIDAIEVGNEPDEYYRNGHRPSNYTMQDYFDDFNTWKEHIMPVLPGGTKLMGASWAFTQTMQSLQSFENQQHEALSTFSQHLAAAAPSNDPADDFLLTPGASESIAQQVAPRIPITHSLGTPFRIGELTSISDGGIQNICQSFSAALWSIDTMFELTNVGADGVNWFATGNATAPFTFSTTYSGGRAHYSLTSVTPLYYGLLFFQVALGDGAQMLPVNLNTAADVKVWATEPHGRNPRATVINKDESASGNVAIRMPGYSKAEILRLSAPSYHSVSGITFAGQTMDGSRTGELEGTKNTETIDGNNGLFYVPMPITSAALVIFSN